MNIAIVGAGIMGRMLSWQLTCAGYRTSLFDKDRLDEEGSAAAHTAAGMLTPYAELESAEPLIFELGMRSLSLWPAIMSDLGITEDYFQQGSLVVAHANDRADYEHFKSHVGNKLSNEKLASMEIDRIRINELEPELPDQFYQAMYFPDECWLSVRKVLDTLLRASKNHGCKIHSSAKIKELTANKLVTEDGEQPFDWVIDCRGLGAKHDMKNLRGVRGELIWLEAPEVNIQRLVRLMHPRYGLYVAPQKHNNLYIVGATQIESNDAGPITLRSTMELLSAAYSIHPGFGEARIIQTKTNCRPALADNLPKIELQDGLIRVNGLFRHGYLLAPTLAAEVVQIIGQTNYQTPFDQLVQKAS